MKNKIAALTLTALTALSGAGILVSTTTTDPRENLRPSRSKSRGASSAESGQTVQPQGTWRPRGKRRHALGARFPREAWFGCFFQVRAVYRG